MAEQYTSKERVMAVCKAESTDRVPMNIHVPRAHELAGFTAKEAVFEPDKALQIQIKAHEMFPSDMINVPGDPTLPTTSAATYEARYGEGARENPRLEDKSALAELQVRDPRQSRRWSKYFEMCYKTQEAFKDTWVSALMGAPWTIAVALRGVEALIYDTMDDPQFVRELMRYSSELAKIRGDALIETGVALMFAETSASSSVVSPSIYRDFVHPYLKDVIDHFKQQGAWIDLHICGSTDPIVEYTTSLDVDIIDIDGPTSLKKTVEISQKRLAIRGNIAADLFRDGTPEQIEEEVKNCIEIAAPGSAYILSPGCTVPHDSAMENIKAFWEAGLKYGRYQN